MDLGLKGKIALVTGASRGLGYATALELACEGVRVAINSRSAEKLATARERILRECDARGNSGEVLTLPGDITDPEVPAQLVNSTVEALGGLDILITNAGGPPAGSFTDFDDAGWYRGIELSLMSHVRLIRAALPYLRQSAAASVLTITSYSVKQPIPNLILSNSIRAATVGLTKSLALELGREGIRFNSILPASTDTERIQELLQARAQANHSTVEEEKQKQAQQSVLGRISRPEEFGRPAAFLVSPAASYITGVMLSIDGGMYKGTL